jgi:hypothetical protein
MEVLETLGRWLLSWTALSVLVAAAGSLCLQALRAAPRLRHRSVIIVRRLTTPRPA